MHLLSDEEDRMARIFVWLGATEVREQMPMWPDPHRLPLFGWHPDSDPSLGEAPGLLEIAKKAGINHGRYWATKIPFIATTDLMVRFGVPPNDRLILCQCKPRKLAEAPENGRKRERLVLETLYALAIGAYSIVIHEDYLPSVFHENLIWLEPLRSEFLVAQASQQIFDFAHAFMRRCDSYPIEACVEYAASRTRMNRVAGHASFRMAAWAGLIDADLLHPIQLTRLLRRDGGRLRAQITQELLCPE
ncbi:TnsA endonuclease N-terminal domain-containing protein [Variovorax sp. OK605]|uniref:TnsA endonuclease N-terminal domain-containing protein n=1 Tax=Variovorax sp. OK605 TaxID=1855317 RepID=UPI001C4303B6|nr:TnsA endonuclease N-terminal domain-containing protein [Variovorax sp. OK605]